MDDTKDISPQAWGKATAAQKIIEYILVNDDPEHMRKHLRLLIDHFLVTYETDLKERDHVYHTFTTLYQILRDTETCWLAEQTAEYERQLIAENHKRFTDGENPPV